MDEISDGRLILGLGAGNNKFEHRAFGYDFNYRTSRFEEALTIIQSLLRTGQANFEGRFYQVRDCELLPRGPRPAGLPYSWVRAVSVDCVWRLGTPMVGTCFCPWSTTAQRVS